MQANQAKSKRAARPQLSRMVTISPPALDEVERVHGSSQDRPNDQLMTRPEVALWPQRDRTLSFCSTSSEVTTTSAVSSHQNTPDPLELVPPKIGTCRCVSLNQVGSHFCRGQRLQTVINVAAQEASSGMLEHIITQLNNTRLNVLSKVFDSTAECVLVLVLLFCHRADFFCETVLG